MEWPESQHNYWSLLPALLVVRMLVANQEA